MPRIKFVPYNKGFEELRRSPAVAGEVERVAANIATAAGPGYVSSGQQGKKGPAPSWNPRRGPGFQGRYRAIVYPKSWPAIHDNGRNNTLAKLVGGFW